MDKVSFEKGNAIIKEFQKAASGKVKHFDGGKDNSKQIV